MVSEPNIKEVVLFSTLQQDAKFMDLLARRCKPLFAEKIVDMAEKMIQWTARGNIKEETRERYYPKYLDIMRASIKDFRKCDIRSTRGL